MLVQIGQHGLTGEMKRRIICLSMFWHFLDIIWIGVFNFVYLFGSDPVSTHSLNTPRDTDIGTPGSAHGHDSRRSYRIGVALSILLTVVPFWLVMSKLCRTRRRRRRSSSCSP